jgi:hypothetical protein
VELEQVIPDAVGKNPKSAAAAGEEALPPPMIILRKSVWRFIIETEDSLTSEQSWLYVAITVTSTTVIISTVETTLRKPKT